MLLFDELTIQPVSVKKYSGTGVMLAYMLPPDVAKQLTIPDGEEEKELHVTLLYLGKSEHIEDGKLETLKKEFENFCKQYAPLQGYIGGQGRFPATESSDNKDVLISLVDVARLEALREDVIKLVKRVGIEPVLNHGYTPHVTIAYVDPTYDDKDRPKLKPIDIAIDGLTCSIGTDRTKYPMNGHRVYKGVGPTTSSVHTEVPLGEDEDEDEEDNDEVDKANTCHVSGGSKGGQFCSTSGGSASSVKVKPSKSKAWSGDTQDVKNKPSKLEVGKLGEDIIVAHLKAQGMKDARPLNIKVNNFPVDLVQDHGAIEVKTGLVSNGKSAQQWRATIGQPGKEETKWLKKASPKAKAAWNLKKQQAILDRKEKALKDLGQLFGKKVKGSTYALIINPDTRKADIYKFPGFHLRVAWNSPQAKKGYVGTVSY